MTAWRPGAKRSMHAHDVQGTRAWKGRMTSCGPLPRLPPIIMQGQ